MNEEWRKVGESMYSVSSLGRVRRDAPGRGARPGYIIRPQVWGPGYLIVTIHTGRRGGSNTEYVHRLVAEAFLGACPRGRQVNHKDGDKTNAALANLEYVTGSENMRHAMALGLWSPPRPRGEGHGRSKLTEAGVREIRTRLKAGDARKVIAGDHGVSVSLINELAAGRGWAHVV